jgi:hypothetical protein
MSAAALAVLMEAPASLEEEFNDWYDTEHFPQRMALPGFVQGQRWVCVQGWPRYLAVYDLSDSDALSSRAYRDVSAENSTPWSRRILPRTIGRQRLILEALNQAAPGPPPQALLLAAWPTAGQIEALRAAVDKCCQPLPGLLTARFYRDATGTPRLFLIATFDHPVDINALNAMRRLEGIGSCLFNLYLPYSR